MRASPKRFIRFIVQLIVLVPTTLFIVFQMFSFKTSGFRYVYKDLFNVHKHEHDAENSVVLNLSSLIYKTLDIYQLNNTRHASRETTVFFNRVPKVGSEMLLELLKQLAITNGFDYIMDMRETHYIHTASEEMGITSQINLLNAPFVFHRSRSLVYAKHLHFCNFTRYGYKMPIYINLVRDPIERVISQYYYIRSSRRIERDRKIFNFIWPSNLSLNNSFETCVVSGNLECQYILGSHREGEFKQAQFFCGWDDFCGEFGGQRAYQQAKQNVEKYYSVVGVLEEMGLSLQVMESYIPRFFLGVSKLYRDNLATMIQVNKNIEKPFVSKRIKEMLQINFTREIEFYEFCKQRIHLQYAALLKKYD